MKRFALLSFLLGLLPFVANTQNELFVKKCAPELRALFRNGGKSDMLVVFSTQADVRGAASLPDKLSKAAFVYTQLENTLARTQARAIQILREKGFTVNSLRIVNALAVDQADASIAQDLAALPEIAWIGSDPWVHFDAPTESSSISSTDRNTIEWGVAKIHAPEVWALGYNGGGITVGGADTGYDWVHPAIQPHYRGWDVASMSANHNYNWHDAVKDFSPLNYDTSGNPGVNPCGINIKAPCDDNSHGTHTMGTMTGDDGNGNMIGVAPGAKWIGCRNMERGWGRPSTYLGCFEWFLAPTDANNENPDISKAPHVINNSWYCAQMEGCTDSLINDLLRIAIVNLKASGVVVVVSNGNEGPWCGSAANPPAYFEESFSIGATRSDDGMANFSSRGPVLVDGSNRIKPNVSAPGQNVRSCTPNNNYSNFSGTSMAGPHVAGAVALMLSANPQLAGHVSVVENILEQTSIFFPDSVNCGPSIGSVRPNHSYGWGRIDALAAVNQALLWSPPVATHVPVYAQAAIYPNPVNDYVLFDLQHFNGNTLVELFDMEGKLILQQKLNAGERQLVKVSIPELANGIYIYKVSGNGAVVSGKLVKS